VGEKLARGDEWRELLHTFIPAAVAAELARHKWPVFLRPFLDPFLPEVSHLRRLANRATQLVRGEIHARKTMDGTPLNSRKDCLDWFEEVRRGRDFDPVSAILFLLPAGTHNVSLTMTAIMYELLVHPELMESIRMEAAGVISKGGWTNSSLDKMVLLDRFMRETQRYRMTDPGKFL
jgi:cytochrome P450